MITFSPSERPISVIVQLVVPEADPEVGSHFEQAHVTDDTDTLSDDVPPRDTVLSYPLSYVALEVGVVIVAVGSVVSSPVTNPVGGPIRVADVVIIRLSTHISAFVWLDNLWL
jgi:hypothetical protein